MEEDYRPPMLRHADGRSAAPLLYAEGTPDRGRMSYIGSRRGSPQAALLSATGAETPTRPTFSRRSTMRSRSPPAHARMAARKKYMYAAFFLVVSLVSFTVQTMLGAWVQRNGWDKAYCMLYLTHGSWALLWPVQLAVLRFQKRDVPWPAFWRRHVSLVRSTAQMVERQDLDIPRPYQSLSPVPYMLRTTAFITSALTVAGLSWYVAVNMTTPSDLTAIYNCSAFFAYAFSVPILKEKLRADKSIAVLIAIAGVMVVAYGDTRSSSSPPPSSSPLDGVDAAIEAAILQEEALAAGKRFMGNVIIGLGSVLYGLYEVIYKRYACPPDGCSPGRGMIFANTFGSMIGCFTLSVLWVPIPLLHWLGLETFALPTGKVAWYLFLSVVMNATFAGSFLVLISLTSPVLTSVASLLTIFIVAVADWLVSGEPPAAAAMAGGCMIIVAFLMLSWSTWREMAEEERRREVDIASDDDDDESGESDKDDV
ncbi:uncharacterized protein E0L32_002228 [Thyridium curvatum]|uniref:EamA domain-containing protein n=1 Tax=Thyridium curvatum TaxID=1093900 RepID=A0A507AEF5_9PEZI|nr:uncharacterized protein E0L32_002228 [Thyridium curvatum]TPX06732.1 hypothetical protein E0L32_002228 [Thyridium curvatum]